MPIRLFNLLLIILLSSFVRAQTTDTTYADRLGFPKGSRVLILHVDDAGMSFDSNLGAEMALTKGVSTSVSVMMPCPWVPGFVQFLKTHPEIDAGLHLTLTFKCEEIEQEIRGHSRKEIADMLVEKEEYLNEVEIQNTKLYEFVIRFQRFVNGESRDHKKLFALHQNNDISQAVKSTHYLEILSRVKDKLDDLKTCLPKDILKYRGILD